MKSVVLGTVLGTVLAAVTSLSVLAGPPAQAAAQAAAPGTLTIEYAGRTAPNENGWNNGTVTVQWRCTWANGNAYDISREVSDEGADQAVTGTCEQPDGSRVQDTQDGINIDYTSPDIAFLTRTSANAAGWNKKPVQVQWTCTDTLSGAVSETVSKTVSKEGHDQAVSGTCRDLAGNDVTGAEVDRISVDLTAPSAEMTDRTVANADGWNNTDTTVTWTCGDAMSGPAYDETTTTLKTDGADLVATGRCVDKAGNVYNPTETVNLDETAPSTTLTGRTEPNANGWNNTGVDLEWTCTDATSGPANAGDTASLNGEGAAQSATGTCHDIAGNTSSNTVSDVKIDLTAPVTTYAGATPAPNAAGWNNTPVTTTFDCTDALSGSDPVSAMLNDEGADQVAHATCTDRAGNTADGDSTPVDIDLTDPSVLWNSGPDDGSKHYFGFVPKVPTCTALDSLSGAGTCAVTGYSTAIGSHTLTATAADVADNASDATRSYSVSHWTARGFFGRQGGFQPSEAGTTKHLQFEVFAGKRELTNASLVGARFRQTRVSCSSGAAIGSQNTLTSRAIYSGGVFVAPWHTPSSGCYSVRGDLADGSSLRTAFKVS